CSRASGNRGCFACAGSKFKFHQAQGLVMRSAMTHEFFPSLTFLDLASPVTFTQPLQNQQAEEGGSVTLSCEVSNPSTPVQWKKGGTVLRASDKYRMRQDGAVAELTIHNLSQADAGDYTCDTGDQQTTTTARLEVKGRVPLCPDLEKYESTF
uniref:Ig-like domain-containing protein n=1 Tax=Zonotrichia albicollis TaxID=44394 RepID=A0A8D2N1H6_ZONAL